MRPIGSSVDRTKSKSVVGSIVLLRRAAPQTADFFNAHLTGARLSGADLTGATIKQAQLDQACGIINVKLDPGLTIKPCPKPELP